MNDYLNELNIARDILATKMEIYLAAKLTPINIPNNAAFSTAHEGLVIAERRVRRAEAAYHFIAD